MEYLGFYNSKPHCEMEYLGFYNSKPHCEMEYLGFYNSKPHCEMEYLGFYNSKPHCEMDKRENCQENLRWTSILKYNRQHQSGEWLSSAVHLITGVYDKNLGFFFFSCAC